MWSASCLIGKVDCSLSYPCLKLLQGNSHPLRSLPLTNPGLEGDRENAAPLLFLAWYCYLFNTLRMLWNHCTCVYTSFLSVGILCTFRPTTFTYSHVRAESVKVVVRKSTQVDGHPTITCMYQSWSKEINSPKLELELRQNTTICYNYIFKLERNHSNVYSWVYQHCKRPLQVLCSWILPRTVRAGSNQHHSHQYKPIRLSWNANFCH